MRRAIGYRSGQFLGALAARSAASEQDCAPAAEVLDEELLGLFMRMPVEDRGHGLEVLRRLRAAGHGSAERSLLAAGLLHDVGKAGAGVGLTHRVARVVLQAAAPPIWRWLCGRPTGWRRPFWAIAMHAERGAEWIASAGGDADLVRLVRYHEASAPALWTGELLGEWHAALAAADAAC